MAQSDGKFIQNKPTIKEVLKIRQVTYPAKVMV